MKSGRLYLIIFTLFLDVIFIGCGEETRTTQKNGDYYTCPMHPEVKQEEPGQCPICGMDLTLVQTEQTSQNPHSESGQSEIEYWTCPMHPEVRQPDAGQCPICGMDLVSVYSETGQNGSGAVMEGGTLRISPVQQQLIGLKYDTVEIRALSDRIRTVGKIVPDERKVAEITFRVTGYVEKTHVNEIGVPVKKGQKLATIYSPELVSSQQDYLVTLRSGNQELIRKARERLRLLLMPESEIKRLEAQNSPLLEVTLEAPFRGIVLEKEIRDGMQIIPGMTLYTIADLSAVWLLTDIYEADLPYIRENQIVEFELQGMPGKKYSGRVDLIYPTIDPMTRTLKIRIELPNPEQEIKIDQYGWVNFIGDLGEQLSVHQDAVLITGQRAIVFKTTTPGQFSPVEVELGPLAGNYYQVLNGLNPGDRVVTSGRFFLDAESRLRGIGAQSAHQH